MRGGLFALPLFIVIGVYLFESIPHHFDLWSSITAPSRPPPPVGRAERTTREPTRSDVPGVPASGVQAATAIQAGKPTVENTAPQVFTRPPEVLPRWHRFPELPPGLKPSGPVEAELLLSIAADGTVAGASVTKSTGLVSLDQQGVAWVMAHWRYRPALKGRHPAAATTSAIVVFVAKPKGPDR